MDGNAIAIWSAAGVTVASLFIKSYFDDKRTRRELDAAESRRIADREQDRLDRRAAAELTAAHRDLMAAKLDANTEKTEQAAVNTEKLVEKISAGPQHIDVTVKTDTP